ncbi:hypothetical protein M9458_033274, partial [Cirrhinus mrigala]
MESERKSETEDALETRSVVTHSTTSSKRSSRTSAGMAAAKARARAEAERTRAYYVKKETELKIEKVRMEGSLTALEHEKEAAAAMAEVRILEEAIESMEGGSCHSGSQIVPPIDPVQRTSDYVEHHLSHSNVVSNAEASLATPHVEFVSEQLDLMIKWLGSKSTEYVRRIRSVNIRYPDVGLKMAWDRLEEMYGSPEAVEKALLDKLEKFPKISKQDPLKLQELGDLLCEIHPIVEKLPYHLQEKWIYQVLVHPTQTRVKQNLWLKGKCKEGLLCLPIRQVWHLQLDFFLQEVGVMNQLMNQTSSSETLP